MLRLAGSTPRYRWLAFAVMLAIALVLGAGACSGTSTSSVTPTTGIIVRAETLITGRGCGKNPGQVFKYAVVVFGYKPDGDASDLKSYSAPVVGNVYDCFADGAFIDLPAWNGSSTFRLEVYAYNEPAYAASRGAIESAAAAQHTETLRAALPTWTTVCTATQQQLVMTLAVCAPLGAGVSGLEDRDASPPKTEITLATNAFKLSNGQIATCANLPSGDGGTDAEAGDGGLADGAVDASAADAGAAPDAEAVRFTKARIRYRVGAEVGPTVDVTCPTPYVAEVPADPRPYQIDVGVLDSADIPLGETTCAVTSVPGSTSPAVCP